MQFFASYIGLLLLWLTQITGNLGNAIIAFTVLLKTLLLPIAFSSQRQMERMRLLQPKINELKTKHKNDPKAFQVAQTELLKTEKVNPVAGCIPQIIQLVILIMLYQVLVGFFFKGEINGTAISTNYLWLDLAKPDQYYIIPIIAGLVQFVLSYMMLPLKKKEEAVISATKKPEEKNDFSQVSESMQRQMVFMLPVMTTLSLIFLQLPSGLGLYWIVTTVYTIIQQYFVAGLGSLAPFVGKIPIVGEWLLFHQPSLMTNATDTSLIAKQNASTTSTAQENQKLSSLALALTAGSKKTTTTTNKQPGVENSKKNDNKKQKNKRKKKKRTK